MKTKNYILSKNLNNLVNNSGLLQKEVASRIGIKDKCFSTYCTGKCFPTYPTLQKIAKYFHLSIDELLSDPDIKENIDKAFIDLFAQLNESDKQSVIFMIRGLMQKEEYSKKGNTETA